MLNVGTLETANGVTCIFFNWQNWVERTLNIP